MTSGKVHGPMPVQFAIETSRLAEGTPVVAVAGEIDLFTAPEFKQAVTAAIDDARDNVVVDLSETTFMDSSSLGVLIAAHRHAVARGGELIVVCGNEAILKTLEITGLDGVFTLQPSLDAAA